MHHSRGFTLVELMVATAVGLVILGGVLTVMANSKKNYSIQDSVARLQENARFAMHFINYDLRMAGYFGCSDDITEVHNQLNLSANGDSNDYFALFTDNRLEGLNAEADPTNEKWYPSLSTNIPDNRVAGTDAFAVRFLDPTGIDVVQEMPTQSANLKVNQNTLLHEGDIVMVTDCESADVFQITNLQISADVKQDVVHNSGDDAFPGNNKDNSPHKLSKRYGTDAQIMRFNSFVYYIGTSSTSGRPALYRQRLQTVSAAAGTTPTNEELVDGVENMQILFGEDTLRNDRVPDVYRTADEVADWNNVVAARVVLLAYSQSSATEAGTYFAGADDKTYNLAFSSSDSDAVSGDTGDRIRRRFLATTMLRNIR